jgi:hypothetical protein
MGHMPGGTSVKSILHYAQSIDAEEFQLYDYGSSDANDKRYGQIEPPIVDLTRIREAEVPIAMFIGKDDDLGDIVDSRWARDQILDKGLGADTLVHYKEYNGG